MSDSPSVINTVVFTALALMAFAANSILCRLALGDLAIDAFSFTVIRLLSAMATLSVILMLSKKSRSNSKGSWSASAMLFIYALTFSWAYVSLDTATGALVLFGSVQISMLLFSLFLGHRLRRIEWLGLLVSFSGFIYLVFPNITTPSLKGFLLMAVSGVAWAVYSLKGRASVSPLSDTAYNFFRTAPFVMLLFLLTQQNMHLSSSGVLYAFLSGSLASGVGYSFWYWALTGLNFVHAAVLQLLVPVIAAAGGVFFVSETITIRLLLASMLVLGGILMVVLARSHHSA